MDVKIALIGGGKVGQGFLHCLRKRQDRLSERHGIQFQVVAVCDRISGSVLSPVGLPLREILPGLEDRRDLAGCLPPGQAGVFGLDPLAIIELSRADVVVECTYSDLTDAEPASSYIRRALTMRKHVITSNKGPIALHHDELAELARVHKVRLAFGATVMSGTPVMRVLRTPAFADEVVELKGVLNVTSNLILDAMEKGESLEGAVASAIRGGCFEADRNLDLDGHDSLAKLRILISVLDGRAPDPARFQREGIGEIGPKAIQSALERNMRFRLVSNAWRAADGGWEGQVGPFKLPLDDPLHWVTGQRSSLRIRTETMGEILIEGPGAGRLETGTGILSDLLAIYSR